MNTTAHPELIEQLAAAIAAHTAPMIPLAVDIWDAAHAAAYLKCSPRTLLERYAPLPGFPAAIRLPSAGGMRGQPRWKAAEVIKWANGHQERAPRVPARKMA